MTSAKAKKPVKKVQRDVAGKAPAVKKTPAKKGGDDRESVELLFKEVGMRMKALSGDEPGEAGLTFDYGAVIGLLDRILAIESGNRNALIYKGVMLMGMQEQAKALECFNAILKANPGDSEALNNKAIVLYGMGKVKEAMTYVDKALEIDKRYGDALMNKAVMLYEQGQVEEARKFLARANTCDRIGH
ncbi:MAG TPA: tetratricopeptide repeat protein [Methanocella sp.]|jgi:tetratricopeptide (TPR) repeat protein